MVGFKTYYRYRKGDFFMMKKLDNGKTAIDLANTVVEMLLPYKVKFIQ